MRFLSEYSRIPGKIRAEIYIMKGTQICLVYYDNDKYRNYMIPGGKVEEDEEIVDAAKRECLEEAGVRVKNVEFFEKNRYNLPKFLYEIHSFIAEYDKEDNSLLGDGPEGTLGKVFVSLEEAYKLLYEVSRSNRKGSRIASNSIKIIEQLINRNYGWTPEKLKLTTEQMESAFKRAEENSKSRVKWIDKK